MVIFHCYVSLLEGNPPKRKGKEIDIYIYLPSTIFQELLLVVLRKVWRNRKFIEVLNFKPSPFLVPGVNDGDILQVLGQRTVWQIVVNYCTRFSGNPSPKWSKISAKIEVKMTLPMDIVTWVMLMVLQFLFVESSNFADPNVFFKSVFLMQVVWLFLSQHLLK